MTEKEVLEMIKESAEKEKMPDALRPEQIKEKLQATKQKKAGKWLAASRVAAVALVLFLGGAVGLQTLYLHSGDGAYTSGSAEVGQPEMMAEEDTEEESVSITAKKDAGKLYTVAKNYDEVYDALQAQSKEREIYETTIDPEYSFLFNEGSSTSGADSSMSTGTAEIAMEDSVTYAQTESSTAVNYSKTNVQMEGVDESDIVKTDGSYLYTVSRGKVIITDIRNGDLKEAGEINVVSDQAADDILEMYVAGKQLNLIVQRESTGLTKESTSKNKKDVYSVSSDVQTQILTYDISDPKKPEQTGTMTQDGYYHTSRKIGDIIYLFTDKSMSYPSLTKEEAVLDDEVSGWIPLVNGKAVEADCIYLSDSAQQGLVISAMDVKKPNKVVDNTVILNGYVDIYVSTDAVYLYQTDYASSDITTQIAKFELSNGSINAVDAASVKGEIRDTFAINESNGSLRVLTTADAFTGESTNGLYLFDKNMKMTGKLENIAEGEEIYAARYLGNMAYFVTYRNTDPLFAVDLSDVTKPELIGELKITGFSEYLHFWGKDKLVGIGYETDPKTGEQKGLKLTMFDISDPKDLKELNTVVLKNVDYSQALYEYKAVLADADENLFGFTTEDYTTGQINYLLFSWESGAFKNLLTDKVSDNFSMDEYRGVYVGEMFYIVNRDGIRSYDRKNGYHFCKELLF